MLYIFQGSNWHYICFIQLYVFNALFLVGIFQLSVNRLQSSQMSRSKCSHLRQHISALSACTSAERATCKRLSRWIINGRNVMTDALEQPIPPHLWPSTVALVSMVWRRRRPTQFVWLILSSTLSPSLYSIQPELSWNLSKSLSAWLQGHKTSVPREDLPIANHSPHQLDMPNLWSSLTLLLKRL